ncbi:MAG: hypothetical protein WCA48_24795 [Pseudomonas gingeri]
MSETEIIFAVKRSPEGGYEARAVGHPIFAQADTLDELKVNLREAVRCHFGDGTMLLVIHLDGVTANRRVLGSAKGEFTVPDDFNDPLPKEIEDLFW